MARSSRAALANMVPHYDIFGAQHPHHPYKDKSHLLQSDVRHHRWLEPNTGIRTRSELQQARQRGRVPDATYDFDGDGAVGSLDYFVGRNFDRDNDGHLTASERRKAERALDSGFLDRFHRGLDSQGDTMRLAAVQQKRGVIFSADNTCDAFEQMYPAHHNAHKAPKHQTRTALQLSRTAELKGAGAAVGERYISANAPVPEPHPPTSETHPRKCEVSHISERAEADHQLARVRAGLLPMQMPVNVERECRTVGLSHEAAPAMATRSQLLETRREGMKRACEELRVKGEQTQLPNTVRKQMREDAEFYFREADPNCMTVTKLKENRRRDKVEYDMAHFGERPREYPRFADRQDVPFWADHASPGAPPAAEPPPPVTIPKAFSEPTFKITEVPFKEAAERYSNTPAGLPGAQVGGPAAFGSNTKKRFCTDLVERGQARNQPRLFDRILPLHTTAADMEPLDVQSSMAPVREKAMRARAEQRKRHMESPRRSRLWSETLGPTSASVGGSQTQFVEPGAGNLATLSTDGLSSLSIDRRSLQDHGAGRAEAHFKDQGAPRFFGTAGRSASETGIRCGGFQRLDWPANYARTAATLKARSDAGRMNSRERRPSALTSV